MISSTCNIEHKYLYYLPKGAEDVLRESKDLSRGWDTNISPGLQGRLWDPHHYMRLIAGSV